MITKSIKKDQIVRNWHLVDATDKTLGRLASSIAQVIRGKTKVQFTPNIDMGDFVVVVNASKIKLTGNKKNSKFYWSHSGYPGSTKEVSYKKMISEYPDRVIANAVKGMLPHNKLGRQLNKHLKVYAGNDHPHDAQQLNKLDI
tara:strand:+ start:865 stop:1293 length:429 start_codon:yes stop_codon:yes gene_type:complete